VQKRAQARYKILGLLSALLGLLAISRALFVAIFVNVSFVLAYEKYSELYELERTYGNLRFFLVLTLGLCGIFFGYKTVEIKTKGNIPVMIHWTFMAVSVALDLLVFLGVISGLDLKV